MRQLSVLFLISCLLVLGSCPLRKVVHHITTGSNQADYFGKVRHVASTVCNGKLDVTGTRAATDMPASGNDVSEIPALFPITNSICRLPFPEKGFVFLRKISTLYADAIPIYLRIRVLLI